MTTQRMLRVQKSLALKSPYSSQKKNFFFKANKQKTKKKFTKKLKEFEPLQRSNTNHEEFVLNWLRLVKRK